MITAILLVAAIIGIFAYMLYAQRQKKKNDVRSHHIILLDGFPAVHIPISLSRDDAEAIAGNLQAAYNAVWKEMGVIYGVKSRPAGIAVIGTSLFDVDPAHPNIMWIAPRDKIFIKVQPTMYYWFMLELHNIFRYQLHGIKWIYNTKDSLDEEHCASVWRWIEENC